ncbi:hypothetical protein [Puniceibacterium confluentis]|uniref:hypothetical protein n=1 Tax=Puniceibacterium confluentis TaxID=1958944 RepID=UPI0011B574AD|nr:hypothetical protein [Puniceibacterium confluentis]
MATLDLHVTPAHRGTVDRSTLVATLTAVALVLLMGLPALMAPPAEVPADGWHGNAALSRAH